MLNQLARFLSGLGLSANVASFIGLCLSFAAAGLIVCARFEMAALLVLLSGLFDLLDGRIARLSEKKNSFGALLDSTLDRYGDAALYAGVLIYYLDRGEFWYALLALSALVGSFQISYVRARSQGLSQECRVGFWERGERLVLLVLGLALNNLKLAVVYLGVLTHGTAWERLGYSRRVMEGRVSGPAGGGTFVSLLAAVWRSLFCYEGSRRQAGWMWKALFFTITLAILRLP